MMQNILQLPHSRCAGCGVCAAVCPVGCIQMEPDPAGFRYPRVSEKCIGCGKCLNFCPAWSNAPDCRQMSEQCFAAWATDPAMRYQAASGGMFSALAEYWICDLHGCVCGAVYDENMRVCHKICRTSDELAALRGSKYVQSDLDETLTAIREILFTQKLPLLFCGTPCQCAAVKRFCENSELLFCCDLICYGVGAPKIFAAQIQSLEKKYHSKISAWNMRSKHFSWQFPVHQITLSRQGQKILKGGDDAYSACYSRGIGMRDSCYHCQYCDTLRTGEITLGDFWGLKNGAPYSDEDFRKGISLVLINSGRGKELLQTLIRHGKLQAHEESVAAAVHGNVALRHSVAHPAHERFMADFAGLDYAKVKDKYFTPPLWKRIVKTLIPLRLKATWSIRKKNRSC